MTEHNEERVVPMRLQKFLARAGAASRRGSENLMTAGRVTVNGQVVCELGSKVDPLVDVVAVDGLTVSLADEPVSIMLHKPSGFVTTMLDPHGRPTVAELVPTDKYPGLFPIGRLDADTTGLLLFSTDGELGNGLLHPRHHVSKRYLACVEGLPTQESLAKLCRGIELEDGLTAPAEVCVLKGSQARQAALVLETPPVCSDSGVTLREEVALEEKGRQSFVRVVIKEGKKRQVKRMLGAVGTPVCALHRDSFGPLELGDLERGSWRLLSAEEVSALHAAIEKSDKGKQPV